MPLPPRKGGTGMTEFVEFLHEVFADFGPITARRMFGGWGLYHGGLMFALVKDGRLYLKADEATRHQFTSRGLSPFRYLKKGKTVALSYYLAPEAIYDDREEAAAWATRAYGAAQRAAQAKQGR